MRFHIMRRLGKWHMAWLDRKNTLSFPPIRSPITHKNKTKHANKYKRSSSVSVCIPLIIPHVYVWSTFRSLIVITNVKYKYSLMWRPFFPLDDLTDLKLTLESCMARRNTIVSIHGFESRYLLSSSKYYSTFVKWFASI